jgi:hypothetical protein
MTFFHLGDAPKRRGYWESPIAASCGGRLFPQPGDCFPVVWGKPQWRSGYAASVRTGGGFCGLWAFCDLEAEIPDHRLIGLGQLAFGRQVVTDKN